MWAVIKRVNSHVPKHKNVVSVLIYRASMHNKMEKSLKIHVYNCTK